MEPSPIVLSESPVEGVNKDRRMSDEWGKFTTAGFVRLFPFPDATDYIPFNRCLQGPPQPLSEAQGLHICHAQLTRRPCGQELSGQVPRKDCREVCWESEIEEITWRRRE